MAPIPSNQSSTPMAAFQSESTRVRREVSASEVRSSVAHSGPAASPTGGPKGALSLCVQVGEVPVSYHLVAVVGQALVERALGHQVASDIGETLTVNLGGQPVRAPHRLRGSGEQQHCHSPKPEVRPRDLADSVARLGWFLVTATSVRSPPCRTTPGLGRLSAEI